LGQRLPAFHPWGRSCPLPCAVRENPLFAPRPPESNPHTSRSFMAVPCILCGPANNMQPTTAAAKAGSRVCHAQPAAASATASADASQVVLGHLGLAFVLLCVRACVRASNRVCRSVCCAAAVYALPPPLPGSFQPQHALHNVHVTPPGRGARAGQMSGEFWQPPEKEAGGARQPRPWPDGGVGLPAAAVSSRRVPWSRCCAACGARRVRARPPSLHTKERAAARKR
jgi:hypothetical protein